LIQSGDIWQYKQIKIENEIGSDLIPFHKLQQWLTYSLIDCIETYFPQIIFLDKEDMTALAEYRNGGLFIDSGLLSFREHILKTIDSKYYDVGSQLVVEWRAMTIILMDILSKKLKQKINRNDLSLASILEGGSWRAGRELAFKLRSGKPPINLLRDGTVF